MNLDQNNKWLSECNLTWFEQFMVNIIKCGDVPKHVAIIMDGNRRYAIKSHLDQWHCYNLGFEKMRNILKYSKHLGIEEITIFAFSIENFKRDPMETDLLMRLAIEKFSILLSEKDELIKNDVSIRFIGNLVLLPSKLQKLICEIMLLTRKNKGRCLNVCMAYTSSYELESTVDKLYSARQANVIKDTECIAQHSLNTSLLTYLSKMNPELLIRTSGEIRLSDFLSWQCNYSTLAFIDILWPETTFFEFCKLILKYQLDKKLNQTLNASQVIESSSLSCANSDDDLKKFVDEESKRYLEKLKTIN